jgi:hypothetical protein
VSRYDRLTNGTSRQGARQFPGVVLHAADRVEHSQPIKVDVRGHLEDGAQSQNMHRNLHLTSADTRLETTSAVPANRRDCVCQ